MESYHEDALRERHKTDINLKQLWSVVAVTSYVAPIKHVKFFYLAVTATQYNDIPEVCLMLRIKQDGSLNV